MRITELMYYGRYYWDEDKDNRIKNSIQLL